jgi:hypothetical protein
MQLRWKLYLKKQLLKKYKTRRVAIAFQDYAGGGKYGPPVFQIAEQLGIEETILRINTAIKIF